MIYHISVNKGNWTNEFYTSDYDEFFDAATKVIMEELAESVGPAFITALPAFEAGDLHRLQTDNVLLAVYDYVYDRRANEK